MTVSIGVLAGMGPRSTAPFIDMLISACQSQYGACNDEDFPLMHIISLPTPFRPGHPIDEAAMTHALCQGIESLVSAQTDFIVVPCNLAHCYFAEMSRAAGTTPLLHIAESAVQQLPATVKNVAILATEPVMAAGFWQDKIRAAGKEVTDSAQLRTSVTTLIRRIKEYGFSDPVVRECWQTVLSQPEFCQADAVLVACTDISPLIPRHTGRQIFIDTAENLAGSAIRYYTQLRSLQGDD
ncbi:aspartate/glutamate racemase family protein [Tatumella sp. UCD-D_suzukii]|uniref:aspartate/glutamate racemase family protein n=1 Tax=Tatumella sp. UCD-D_suzukii TaxID=1408192 RepID=UPI00068762DA|nr:aspartate/glutamate racemase family protein [Tatumella sp. UCD-D_suzukii]